MQNPHTTAKARTRSGAANFVQYHFLKRPVSLPWFNELRSICSTVAADYQSERGHHETLK
jgi:hypothetical protein